MISAICGRVSSSATGAPPLQPVASTAAINRTRIARRRLFSAMAIQRTGLPAHWVRRRPRRLPAKPAKETRREAATSHSTANSTASANFASAPSAAARSGAGTFAPSAS